jgi:hypothetical protein
MVEKANASAERDLLFETFRLFFFFWYMETVRYLATSAR